jgi:hypothetical protein
MNCSNCNTPLENNARFCRGCGSPVSIPAQQPTMPYRPDQLDNAPTIPTIPWQPQQTQQSMPPPYPQPTQNVPPQAYQDTPQQPGTFQQPTVYQPATFQQGPPSQPGAFQQQSVPMQPGTFQDGEPRNLSATDNVPPKRKRRGRGCLIGFLLTLIIVVVVATGGWIFFLRPYLHNLAATQMSNVLTDSISQIPLTAVLLPPQVLQVQESTLNNLIVLESAPSDPVQHMQVSITPSIMIITFQVYGFGCTITGIPTSQNGHLVVMNVNVQGLASLIMSSDELTSLLNQKLAEAQTRLFHPILKVQLKNRELDLTLGPPGSV